MLRFEKKMTFAASRCIAFLLLICFLLSFAACGVGTRVTPLEVVRAMHEAEKPTAHGQIYCLSPDASDCKPLDRELVTTLFGDGIYPPEMDGVRDAACFLSYRDACEIGVFLCHSADDAKEMAILLVRRLELLRRERPDCAEKLERASVTVRGRWALLCISNDPDTLLRVFRRIV